MTDVDLPALVATLVGIHQRAPWAHSLTYDRPAHAYDPNHTHITGTVTDDRPPVGRWDDHGNITAHADTEAGRRWNELIRHLKGAHHDLTSSLCRVRGPRVLDPTRNPLDRPRSHVTAHHIQQACTDLTQLVRPLHSWQRIPDPLNAELARVAAAVDAADQQFPAELFNPDPPRTCSDPRRNRDAAGKSLCLGVPHAARNLCESCLRLEADIAEWKDRQRRARWCTHHPDRPKHAVHKVTGEPLCNTCYQAARRAGEFDNYQLVS